MRRFKKAPQSLMDAVMKYVDTNGGYLYAPIPHPDFSKIPVRRGNGRFEFIKPYINENFNTVLDIGMHFGSECHFFEEQGKQVVGIEFDPVFAKIAAEIRDLCDKKFEIYHGDFFNYGKKEFDIICALNIFHHFIKTEEGYIKLDGYLESLRCKSIFFQSSNPRESQMSGSYINFTQDQFAEYIAKKLNLDSIQLIGVESERNIYYISKL